MSEVPFPVLGQGPEAADPTEVKLCACGCGLPVPIAKTTRSDRGVVKGQAMTFIRGHWQRGRTRPPMTEGIEYWADLETPKYPLGKCQCGCNAETYVSHKSSAFHGYVRGKPRKYRQGHAPRPETSETIESRFWQNVDKESSPYGCWIWKPGPAAGGYGRFHYAKKKELAHRFSWRMSFGPIPHNLLVCHDCDANYAIGDPSYRLCVNPNHLFLGTNQENIIDAVEKGRMHRGERSGMTKLTGEQVVEIRRRYTTGETLAAISIDYGIDGSTVCNIGKRKLWKHIQ